jgi:hypothetical protein
MWEGGSTVEGPEKRKEAVVKWCAEKRSLEEKGEKWGNCLALELFWVIFSASAAEIT